MTRGRQLSRSTFSLVTALVPVAEKGEAHPQLVRYAFRCRLPSTSAATVGGTRAIACGTLRPGRCRR